MGGGDSDDMLEGKKEITLELDGDCMTETLMLSELCNGVSSVVNEVRRYRRYKVMIYVCFCVFTFETNGS